MWKDADLPGVLQDWGMEGIIDVHVHFMAPQILEKVWAYFDAAGPLLGRPWPIWYRTSDAERVASLRAMGVRGFSALSYAHRPGVAQMMNDWNRGFAKEYPESLWSGTFYPEPDAGEQVAALVSDGVEIFKAHMQVGEFPADHPLLEPVWDQLEQSRTPIVLHAGSGPAPGEHTGPASVRRVLERWPNLTLIIAHLGMPEYDEFMDIAEGYPNVYLDTTMTFVDFFAEHEKSAIDRERLARLEDRILFGSDFPNIPYPFAHQVEVLDRLGLGVDWFRSIAWNNPTRLFPGLLARTQEFRERL